jgi:hypothetical protein
MEPIYPLQEEHVKNFCGNVVCIVTKEGTRHIGIMSSCRGGKVYLNEQPVSSSTSQGDKTYLQGKAKKKGAKLAKVTSEQAAAEQAQTKVWGNPYYGYGPYSPFGEVLAFELAAIAFLFLLL